MQQDSDRSSTTASMGGATHPGETYAAPGEATFTDHISDLGDTVTTNTNRAINYLTEHPLVAGSIAVGSMGAFIGSRLGYMLATRQRQSVYDRAMDNLGLLVAMLGTTFSPRNRERAMQRIADTGWGALGSTQNLRDRAKERISDRMPVGTINAEEQPSLIKQVGYGLSLVPITFALIRNPLVRGVAFRALSRRMRRSRR